MTNLRNIFLLHTILIRSIQSTLAFGWMQFCLQATWLLVWWAVICGSIVRWEQGDCLNPMQRLQCRYDGPWDSPFLATPKSSRQINEPHVVLMLEKHHTFQSPLCARGLLIPNNPLKKLTNLLNLREDRAEGLDEIEESYCKNTRTSANLSL